MSYGVSSMIICMANSVSSPASVQVAENVYIVFRLSMEPELKDRLVPVIVGAVSDEAVVAVISSTSNSPYALPL